MFQTILNTSNSNLSSKLHQKITTAAFSTKIPDSSNQSSLTHTTKEGTFTMVDISSKSESERIAEAQACVYLGPVAFDLVRQNKMKKGDVLTIANIAGVMAAKRTSELIPLCHNIKIDYVDLQLALNSDKNEVIIKARVKAVDKTGAEMEALTAASIAALTVYDMCKAVTKDIVIKSIILLLKTGGKSDFISNLK